MCVQGVGMTLKASDIGREKGRMCALIAKAYFAFQSSNHLGRF